MKPVVEASIIDELRRREVRPRRAELPEDREGDLLFDELLISLATPSAQAHCTRLLDDAMRASGTDYPDDPGLVYLRYVQGLGLAEIADRLQVSEETARKRMHRATSRLRTILTGLAGSAGI